MSMDDLDITDDAVQRALAEPSPHVPDDGFTERVMANLPPTRRPRRARTALLAACAAASAAVLALSPALPFLGEVSAQALRSGQAPLPALVAALSLVAALFSAGAYAALPD